MTTRVTPAQARRLLAGLLSEEAPRASKRRRAPQVPAQQAAAPRESAGEAALAAAIRLHGPDLPPHEREARFHPSRRWRFDFSWKAARVAVECDGGQFAHGGGRHATDADRDKLNHAGALGWRVLRFSPQQIARDPAGCVALIRRALETL